MPNPLRALLGSVTGLARTRLGLVGTELREELARFAFVLLGGCAAIVLAALALAAAAATLIVAAGEARVPAAMAIVVLFAAASAFVVLRVRTAMAARPAAFSASLAELARDREALLVRSRDERSALGEAGSDAMRLVSIALVAYSIGKRLRRGSP